MKAVITVILAVAACALAIADDVEDLSDLRAILARRGAEKKSEPAASADLSGYTFHMVGHAHIDLVYRWRWNEAVHRVARDTFRGVLAMMDEHPELTFAQSQAALYEAIQRDYPAIFEAIKARIAEGRWIVVDCAWCESDLTMPSGESLVRNYLYGTHFLREELGVDSRIAWAPDAFTGATNTLPQILRGCGKEYFVFGRGELPDKKIFQWESPDGSRILAYTIPWAYNMSVPDLRRDTAEKTLTYSKGAQGIKDIMVLYGEGDHGGGPRAGDVEAIGQKQRHGPNLEYATPDKYVEEVLAPLAPDLPVHRDGLIGLGNTQWTSQAGAKKGNRRAENLLIAAEKFNSLGTLYQRKPNFPRVDFNAVWKPVLLYQFHDGLPGTSNDRVYDDAAAAYAWVQEEGSALLNEGLEYIGNRIDTRGDGVPVVVYNSVSWVRTDAARASIRFVEPAETFALRDVDGNEVLWQQLEVSDDGRRWEVLILAENVPSIGYATYRAFPGESPARRSELTATDRTLENEAFRLRLAADGTLESVYDKSSEREVLAGAGNVLTLVHEHLPSSAWSAKFTGERTALVPVGEPELVEQGPVRARIRAQYRSEDSRYAIDTTLYAGVGRIEFAFWADWHECGQTLIVAFPTAVADGQAAVSKPYGYNEGPADGTRTYGQQWADLSNDGWGVSLLSDAKYEYYVDGAELRMGILRGARDMDPRMDEGEHTFTYALYPHAGSWRDSDTVLEARALNQPLIARQEPKHCGGVGGFAGKNNNFALPPVHSLVSVDAPNVEIAVVKMEHEAWTVPQGALVVRLFETAGRPAEGHVAVPMPILRAWETNLIEDDIEAERIECDENRFAFKIRPNQIRTFKIRFSPFG